MSDSLIAATRKGLFTVDRDSHAAPMTWFENDQSGSSPAATFGRFAGALGCSCWGGVRADLWGGLGVGVRLRVLGLSTLDRCWGASDRTRLGGPHLAPHGPQDASEKQIDQPEKAQLQDVQDLITHGALTQKVGVVKTPRSGRASSQS